MKNTDMLEWMNDLDGRFLTEAEQPAVKAVHKRRRIVPALIAAAAAVVCMIAGVSAAIGRNTELLEKWFGKGAESSLGNLPEPKTYNHPDRRTHINMATNDLCTMAASGSLESNRQRVRDVGQDLYDAHGFQAMQEVFINVKTRYPMAQTILSHSWDGVGGWAD